MIKLDLTVKVTCASCGREYEIKVNQEDYKSWKQGDVLIQDAFPYLTPQQRDLLLLHLCRDCWDSIMSTEDPMEDNGEPLDINDYL